MSDLTQLAGAPAASPESAGATQPAEKRVFVTPKAVAKIRDAFAREKVSGGLRLGVLGGGCSGLSYQFKFAPEPRPRDHVFEFEDVRVFVDPKSMVFLDGMTLDWQDSIIQSGFVFQNPHATKSCGCGTSFSA
jgi:iron-sulfur cluster assembly protein